MAADNLLATLLLFYSNVEQIPKTWAGANNYLLCGINRPVIPSDSKSFNVAGWTFIASETCRKLLMVAEVALQVQSLEK